VVSEYCTPVLDRHRIAGIESIDEGTRLAFRYMKRLVGNAASAGKSDGLRAVV
jgi:hypothetical protein